MKQLLTILFAFFTLSLSAQQDLLIKAAGNYTFLSNDLSPEVGYEIGFEIGYRVNDAISIRWGADFFEERFEERTGTGVQLNTVAIYNLKKIGLGAGLLFDKTHRLSPDEDIDVNEDKIGALARVEFNIRRLKIFGQCEYTFRDPYKNAPGKKIGLSLGAMYSIYRN